MYLVDHAILGITIFKSNILAGWYALTIVLPAKNLEGIKGTVNHLQKCKVCTYINIDKVFILHLRIVA